MTKKKSNKSNEQNEKKTVTDEVTENVSDSVSEKKEPNHSTEQHIHNHDEHNHEHTHGGACCGNPRIRFKYAFLVIVLVLICALSEHFIKKSESQNTTQSEGQSSINTEDKSHNSQLDELSRKIEELHDEVAYLSSLKQMLISAESNSEQEIMQRKKWQAWIQLAKKIQNNEKIQEEFEIFSKAFEKDQEILEIVENLIKETRGASLDSEKEGVIDISKRYLQKIIKINKVDPWKIREISGYILLSLKKYTIN